MSRRRIEHMPTYDQCVSEAKNSKMPSHLNPLATVLLKKWIVINEYHLKQ